MFVVAVVNRKGGCGKTTLATHLAARYASEGHPTWLGDLDKQASALDWLGRRPAGLPAIAPVALDEERMVLPFGPGRMVIDVPAGIRRRALEVVVKAADALVIPLLPSLFDEAATEAFFARIAELKPVRKGRRPIAVVPNRVRGGTLAARRMDSFLARLAWPSLTRLSDSATYVGAADTGRTIFELPVARTRKLRAEWAPLLAFLDELAAE